MIDPQTLNIEWIQEISEKNRNIDKILVEKIIRALFLLEGLVKVGLDFVFKGGTALILILGSPKRLSIDIDIILSREIKILNNYFKKLSKVNILPDLNCNIEALNQR